MKDKYFDYDIEVGNFLTLEGEKLIAYKKQHWLVLVGPIFFTILCSILIIICLYIIYIFIPAFLLTLFSFISLIVSASLVLITKAIVDWQHHIYIVTTRKILEIWCVPLSSAQISDVFLDQVRTTEVSAKSYSLIHELFNIGDVIISFDRPSKAEVFVLRGVSDPKETSVQIGDALEELMQGSQVWFKRGEALTQSKYIEDIVEDGR